MPVVDFKGEKTSAESVPAASPPAPEPEFHVTFVDTALPPVSLFRQIRDRLRQPKNQVPKVYPPSQGSPVPGAEFHATFVDTTLAPISLFRQIRQRFREPKVQLQSEYYKRGADADSAANSVVSGGEFHATFVERTLPPVSLFRQIAEGLHEPKTPGPIRPGHVTLPPTEVPDYVPEDPNQLNLFASPQTASPLEAKFVGMPEGWQDYHVVMVVDPEVVKWRRRTMYLSSLILHGLLVLLLVFSPDLLRRGRMLVGLPVEVAPKKDYSFLVLPPDVLRKLTEPPPENSPLSDRDRRAQGRSPVINPRGLPMPYSRGNTPLPEIAGGKPAAPPPTPPPAAGGNPAPAAPGPPANQPPNPESQPQVAKNDGLRLEDAKPPSGGGGQGLNLPNLTPGQAIQQSLQSAARGRSVGGGTGSSSGYGQGNGQFQNLEPNFSTEGPLILSDTRGVDFGPYLARVVFAVRRNWYSVMPETARLGEKGRVGIVFEILKDGSVPQVRLVASSGSEPLDRAALTGIHSSVPFPPLPQEFTGNHLVLQFIFLYNLSPGQ
jgi:TonB family protein